MVDLLSLSLGIIIGISVLGAIYHGIQMLRTRNTEDITRRKRIQIVSILLVLFCALTFGWLQTSPTILLDGRSESALLTTIQEEYPLL